MHDMQFYGQQMDEYTIAYLHIFFFFFWSPPVHVRAMCTLLEGPGYKATVLTVHAKIHHFRVLGGFLVVFLQIAMCGFLKRFIQIFWHCLVTTAAFHTP